jgi:hypothetical protein
MTPCVAPSGPCLAPLHQSPDLVSGCCPLWSRNSCVVEAGAGPVGQQGMGCVYRVGSGRGVGDVPAHANDLGTHLQEHAWDRDREEDNTHGDDASQLAQPCRCSSGLHRPPSMALGSSAGGSEWV